MRKLLWILFLVLAAAGLALLMVVRSPMKTMVEKVIVEPGTSREGFASFLIDSMGLDAKLIELNMKALQFNYPEPGHYRVKEGESIRSFLRRVRNGYQDPILLVVREAEKPEMVVGRMARQLALDSVDLLLAFNNPELLERQKLKAAQWGCLLLPNSYQVYYTASPEEISQRLEREYMAFWEGNRTSAALKLKLLPVQVITLASIVEAETKMPDEMPIVAGLYQNRLRDGIPLQSDPTVIFAKQRVDPTFKTHRVYKKDLEIDSPYNTYKNKGLPPGPIRVPSLQAIEATLNPQFHTFLFMCADPNRPGYHAFASNNAGHEVNRQRYIKWLEKNKIGR